MPEFWEREQRELLRNRRASRIAANRKKVGGNRTRDSDPDHKIDRGLNPTQRILDFAEQYRCFGPAGGVIEPNRKILLQLADCCLERSNLLGKSSRHSVGLIALSAHWRDWLRPLDNWQPQEASPNSQFASLARHLFTHYEVPRFLDAAWQMGLSTEAVRYQRWFKQIGRGDSVRALVDLPIALTKKMAHCFARAPTELDIPSALRWAQVRGMGGDEQLARTVLDGRIGNEFSRDEFWLSVIQWLIAHPELAPHHHGPIIDYLHIQKFVPSVVNPLSRRRGLARQPRLVPAQPLLSIKGRTVASLLRAVEVWHKKLRAERIDSSIEWKPSKIPAFSWKMQPGPEQKTFAITELISTEELQEEGRAMRHCVVTYWYLCYSGERSIWSLTVEDSSGTVTRLLTLEVLPHAGRVVQARGWLNREPTDEELSILARWTENGGPSLDRLLTFAEA